MLPKVPRAESQIVDIGAEQSETSVYGSRPMREQERLKKPPTTPTKPERHPDTK